MEFHSTAVSFLPKCFDNIFRIPCQADKDCPFSLKCNTNVCSTENEFVLKSAIKCLIKLMVSTINSQEILSISLANSSPEEKAWLLI